tara:strand:+ start:1445 stop:1807 length:363 start_codon:yes stop_codon:yes gene_type:complete
MYGNFIIYSNYIKMLKRFIANNKNLIPKRQIFSKPSTIYEVLNSSKKEQVNAIRSKISIDINASCIECYNIMKENNLNYIKVTDDNKTLGTLNISDIRSKKIWHDCNVNEYLKIIEDKKN